MSKCFRTEPQCVLRGHPKCRGRISKKRFGQSCRGDAVPLCSIVSTRVGPIFAQTEGTVPEFSCVSDDRLNHNLVEGVRKLAFANHLVDLATKIRPGENSPLPPFGDKSPPPSGDNIPPLLSAQQEVPSAGGRAGLALGRSPDQCRGFPCRCRAIRRCQCVCDGSLNFRAF